MNIIKILVIILLLIIPILIGALIFWGLGNFIILVFKVSYSWTILHGLVCELIYILIKNIFQKK